MGVYLLESYNGQPLPYSTTILGSNVLVRSETLHVTGDLHWSRKFNYGGISTISGVDPVGGTYELTRDSIFFAPDPTQDETLAMGTRRANSLFVRSSRGSVFVYVIR